jgi:hypothetical protein
LFDLDETLVEEAAPAAAAFLATCEIARMRHGIAPDVLHRAALQRARELWRAAPTIGYCQQLGIASWEALWSEFPGEAPQLVRLREWMPAYRCEAWTRAGRLRDWRRGIRRGARDGVHPPGAAGPPRRVSRRVAGAP